MIIVNKDQFFRDVTQRITSSLDINTVLERLSDFLRKYMPLDQLSLYYYTDTAWHIIAQTNSANELKKTVCTPSEELLAWTKNLRRPLIYESTDKIKDLFGSKFYDELKSNSYLGVPLLIDDKPVGAIGLQAKGLQRFTSDHADLIESVATPCALALVNAKNYEALQKNRDIVIDDNRFLNREIISQTMHGIIGENSGLRNVMGLVQQVARQGTTVLLTGETGVGKEVIANAIHLSSPRKDAPYIKLNCGAIAENLIDDELFGHEKGAFTGAVSEKRGRFERANGGTLFLDEIGELPLHSQVRLLRVLQSRMINRVGGEKPIPVDVRIIAATNRDLKQMVVKKQFREDLWFRLNVFPITIPPLRQRKEDITALIQHFVAQKSRQLNIIAPLDIAPDVYERLLNYSWPGNVRELENLVERELVCHRGGSLRFDCVLPDEEEEAVFTSDEVSGGSLSLDNAVSAHISKVLKMTRGKIYGPGGAAELLCMNPSTLRWRILKLGIPFDGLQGVTRHEQ